MKHRISLQSVLWFAFLLPWSVLADQRAADCTREFPGSAENQLRRATCLAEQRQWSLAESEILAYRRRYPASVDAAVLHAKILLELHLPSDANQVISRLLALHPHSVPALTFYAQLSEKLSDPWQAEELLLRCTRYAPDNPAVWSTLGDFYLQNGDPKAVEAFRQAVVSQPGSALAHSGLAQAVAMIPDRQQAKLEFQRAFELNHHNKHPDPRVELRFAEFLRETEEYQESIRFYTFAIQEDSSIVEAHQGRALSLLELEKWELAEKDLDVCRNVNGWRISTLNLLLKVYQHQGETKKATECAAEIERLSAADLAAKNEGNHIADLLRQARVLDQEKKYSEALAMYTQLLSDHPDVDAAWYDRGIANAHLGQLDAAEVDLRHFLQSSPSSASGHLSLGRVLLRKRAPVEARREFRLAETMDPLLLEARLGIAASFIEEANFRAAIEELQQARKLSGFDVDIQLMLAEAFYKNDQPNEAKKEVDVVLQHDPANSSARKMRESLEREKE